jgi:hypothetical protein
MWYNTIPPFIPIDLNMYSMYYFGTKGLDPLIFGIKEKYAFNTTYAKLVPHFEQL